jgi:nucleotide-binding universal stress UspA family protein
MVAGAETWRGRVVGGEDPSGGGYASGTARVVVGVDGSPDSEDALAWAAAEAKIRRAQLEVVYAVFYRSELLDQFPDMRSRERSILASAVTRAREMQPTVQVTGRIAEPPPAKALIEMSAGADLLVLGSRGVGGFTQLQLGSVSQQCAHHAACPVVLVRPVRKDTSSPAGRTPPGTIAAPQPHRRGPIRMEGRWWSGCGALPGVAVAPTSLPSAVKGHP